MKNLILSTIVIMAMSLQVNAQKKQRLDLPYKTAIGVRFQPIGLSLKFNSSYSVRTFELVGYFKDGFTAAGYYYWNITLDKNHTMRAYIGGGGQAGFKNQDNGGDAVFGVAGIVGLDYKFKKLPINISADWQPSYQVGDNEEFQGGWGGLAARFAF